MFPHVRPIRANFRENYQENLPLLKQGLDSQHKKDITKIY